MDPSIYIISVLGLAVLLGLLLIGVIIGSDRVLAERSRAKKPAWLSVEVRLKDACYIAKYDEDRGRPKDVPSTESLAELCASLDETISERYRGRVPPAGLVVSYDMYPWRDAEVPRELAGQIGADFLVFNVIESGAGFSAKEKPTGLAVAAATLDELPGAVESAVLSRWPSLAPDVPAVLNWQRSLTEVRRPRTL